MPHTLLVTYDIADDDRRSEISDFLAAHGARVQYSVFEVTLPTNRRLEERADFWIV
ncbi:CRISPR-associated endonuclease Cas2 [Streptomyces albogriseolus]|uniref:CRISPR-associated endonuclease Cas2 n=1 Tax=Streptomyces albogriseolus TaxID=1887 RepID=UPI003460A9CF